MGPDLSQNIKTLRNVIDTLSEGRDSKKKRKGKLLSPCDKAKPRTLKVMHIRVAKLPGAVAAEGLEESATASKKKSGSRASRFRKKRREGKLRQHKERIVIKKDDKGKLRGNKKFANSGTFRPCSPDPDGKEGSLRFRTTGDQTPRKGGAMISNKGLRQKIPLNRFINRNPENPTGVVRPKCRASIGGLLRSRAFKGTSRSYDKKVAEKVTDLNKKKDGPNISAHEMGQRQKRHHGPSGAAKRHKKYGKLTGRDDNKPHTAKSEWGKRYNRPVVRALSGKPKKAQARIETSKSGKKAKREAKREVAAKRRGEADAGRKFPKNKHLSKERTSNEGARLAKKFMKRTGKSSVTGKGKKKRRQKQ